MSPAPRARASRSLPFSARARALFGCGSIFGPAVKADVIDEDARRTGERREGTFCAS